MSWSGGLSGSIARFRCFKVRDLTFPPCTGEKPRRAGAAAPPGVGGGTPGVRRCRKYKSILKSTVRNRSFRFFPAFSGMILAGEKIPFLYKARARARSQEGGRPVPFLGLVHMDARSATHLPWTAQGAPGPATKRVLFVLRRITEVKQKKLALFPPFWPPTECFEVKNTPGTWPGGPTAAVPDPVAAPGTARRPGENRAERPGFW